MSSHSIADRVAVVGMGCTRFGERWDSSAEDLILEAVDECLDSVPTAGKEDVDAYWLGTLGSGQSGLTLSRALAIEDKPVTRVENFCATGSEAFRNACYAVAAGAYDAVMAVGVEKLKDSGYSGLLRADPPGDGTAPELSLTAPAAFSLLDPAYCAKHGVPAEEMREAALQHLASASVVIKAAAVADYRVERPSATKIKSGGKDGGLTLNLVANPDILKELAQRKGGAFLVGFAAETQARIAHSFAEREPADTMLRRAAADGRPHRLVCVAVEWCNYAIAFGNVRVLMDGRTERYDGPARAAQHEIARVTAGWKAELARRGVDAVLARRSDALATLLELAPGWDAVDLQDGIILFERERQVSSAR